jgi:hypothetical protein
MATRRAVGLEPSLIDNDLMTIRALDAPDARSVTTRVAGPTALVAAKLHKIHNRISAGDNSRLADKDAADVFRLMQTTEVSAFVAVIRTLLAGEVTRDVTDDAITFMRELFGARATWRPHAGERIHTSSARGTRDWRDGGFRQPSSE